MSFGKFGKVSFLAETKIGDFTRYLEEGKLVSTRCKRCGRINCPPRADCSDCMSSEIEWSELGRECKLVTYTVVHFAPLDFRDDLPYVLALAQLKEGPKVFARLAKEIREDEIKIGMDLTLSIARLHSGSISLELKKA